MDIPQLLYSFTSGFQFGALWINLILMFTNWSSWLSHFWCYDFFFFFPNFIVNVPSSGTLVVLQIPGGIGGLRNWGSSAQMVSTGYVTLKSPLHPHPALVFHLVSNAVFWSDSHLNSRHLLEITLGCKMAGRKDQISFGFKFGMKWDFCLNSIEAVNKGMKTLKMSLKLPTMLLWMIHDFEHLNESYSPKCLN